MAQNRIGSVMVVGGGIAGMQTALDLDKHFVEPLPLLSLV